jgi:hypothetical protein
MSFQRHLVSEYIRSHWRPRTIVKYLGEKWWSEVLNFYASLSEDITSIITVCQEDDTIGTHRAQLLRMAQHAPYTSEIAIEMIERSPSSSEIS